MVMISRRPLGQAAGFTLVELMIVLAVFATLVGAALPAYDSFVRNQRVKTASFEIFSTLMLARSEAITRNSAVTVEPTSGTTNWASGWRVLVAGTVLRSQDSLVNISITGPASVTYNGSGRLSAAAGNFQITAAGGAAITPRCISIDLSGRPVTKAEAC
jgi:type IV fimbrial biogenesis protein FimT